MSQQPHSVDLKIENVDSTMTPYQQMSQISNNITKEMKGVQRHQPSQTHTEQPPQQSGNPPPLPPVTTGQQSTQPPVPMGPDEKDHKCCICTTSVHIPRTRGDVPYTLPCHVSHVFHHGCIYGWSEMQKNSNPPMPFSCPHCRHQYDYLLPPDLICVTQEGKNTSLEILDYLNSLTAQIPWKDEKSVAPAEFGESRDPLFKKVDKKKIAKIGFDHAIELLESQRSKKLRKVMVDSEKLAYYAKDMTDTVIEIGQLNHKIRVHKEAKEEKKQINQ